MIDFIKNNKNWLIFALISLGVIIILLMRINALKSENNIVKTNLKAASEQVDTLRLRNGELLTQKQSWILEKDDLQKTYRDSIRYLEKKLNSNILYISRLKSQLSLPQLIHDTTVIYKDSIFIYKFKFNDHYYNIAGTSTFNYEHAQTTIDTMQMYVPLTVGLTDQWKIFVTSSNPYVVFNNIEGALLDKNVYLKQQKKPRWSVGISVGFNAGYDIINRSVYIGPGVGFAVNYRLF